MEETIFAAWDQCFSPKLTALTPEKSVEDQPSPPISSQDLLQVCNISAFSSNKPAQRQRFCIQWEDLLPSMLMLFVFFYVVSTGSMGRWTVWRTLRWMIFHTPNGWVDIPGSSNCAKCMPNLVDLMDEKADILHSRKIQVSSKDHQRISTVYPTGHTCPVPRAVTPPHHSAPVHARGTSINGGLWRPSSFDEGPWVRCGVGFSGRSSAS